MGINRKIWFKYGLFGYWPVNIFGIICSISIIAGVSFTCFWLGLIDGKANSISDAIEFIVVLGVGSLVFTIVARRHS